MKTLIQTAVEKIDPKFNPRIENDTLVVNVPGEETAQRFFKEDNNNVKLTDNHSYLAPEEFNRYLESCEKFLEFKPMRLDEVKLLIGKNISFQYIDYDNGVIKGSGVIKNIIKDKDAFMRYTVEMEVTSGETLTHFYLYKDEGYVLAGDDSDEVLFNVLK